MTGLGGNFNIEATQLSMAGRDVNAPVVLRPGRLYSVEILANVLSSLLNQSFGGLSDPSWRFITAGMWETCDSGVQAWSFTVAILQVGKPRLLWDSRPQTTASWWTPPSSLPCLCASTRMCSCVRVLPALHSRGSTTSTPVPCWRQ